MSDPVSNAEIEDVLSSIRRLVSEDTRPKPQKAEGEPDKLVLTPSLRIKDGLEKAAEAAADDAAESNEKAPILLTNANRAADEARDQGDQPEISDVVNNVDDPVLDSSDPESDDATVADRSAAPVSDEASEPLQTVKVHGFERDPGDFMMTQIAELARAPDTQEDMGEGSDDETNLPDSDDPLSKVEEALIAADVAEQAEDRAKDVTEAQPEVSLDETDGIDLANVDLDQAIHDFVQDAELESAADVSDEAKEPIQDFQSKVAALETLVAQQTAEAAMAAVDVDEDDDAALNDDVAVETLDEPPAAQVLDWEDHRPESTERPEANLSHEPAALTAEADVAEDPEQQGTEAPAIDMDEAALRSLVADIVRQELQGPLGERITRNVRKLVRREIHRVLMSQDFE